MDHNCAHITKIRASPLCGNDLANDVRIRDIGEAAAGEGRVASATRADFTAGAAAVLLRTGHEGQIYELGGDYAWNFHELAETIGDIIGRPVAYQAVDAPTLIDILKNAGLDEGTAGFVAALDSNIAEGALSEVTGHLSTLIGRPTTPLKKGLIDAISA